MASTRCIVALLVLGGALSLSTAALADEDDAPYPGLGHESCRQYLKDVASDQTAQQLYSAWFSGYVSIAYSELALPQFTDDDSELRAANDWIKAYCAKRASDTYLAATVSLLMARERNIR